MHRHVGTDAARERRAIIERDGADVDRLRRPSVAGAQPQHPLVGGELEDADELYAKRAGDQLHRDLVKIVARNALQRELAKDGGRLLLTRACGELRLGMLARGDVGGRAAEPEEMVMAVEIGTAVG